MSGDNRVGGGSKNAATHDDIGGGSNAAASSVNPVNDDYVKIRGLTSDRFECLWREKTGIKNLTSEQIWDHQDRMDACSIALHNNYTISNDQFSKLMADAEASSYEILCNGGTSENWPYPIQKKKKY